MCVLLKALIQPACSAGAISWLAFVVTIFMGHRNGDNKGKPRADTCKVCWLIKSLELHLKGLFHPAFLARVVSSIAFVVTIFMGHGNGDNKGKPRADTWKVCWLIKSLELHLSSSSMYLLLLVCIKGRKSRTFSSLALLPFKCLANLPTRSTDF